MATVSKVEARTLALLLGINAAMFVVEFAAGWVAQSAGLIADSLDMLADAGVYTVALLAVGSTTRRKTHAAAVSGVIQLALAVGLAFEVMATGSAWPDLVIGAAVCALVVRGGVRILKQAKASYAEDRG